MTVWLATSDQYPELTIDDRLLLGELEARGIRARILEWRATGIPAPSDLVVIRSCWDYHLHTNEFLQWLHRLQDNGTRLANGYAPIRATLHKSYLAKLQREFDVRIPATLELERGQHRSLEACRRELGTSELVIKPAVSLSAFQTWRAGPAGGAEDEQRLAAQVASMDVLVQAYVPGIVAGELSLVFIGGHYSHAVRKVPRAGDFRVQSDFGGTATRADVDEPTRLEGQRILDAICPDSSYARIDGVVTDDGFVLMEVEIIDPVLFLGTAPGAAARLARTLSAACSS